MATITFKGTPIETVGELPSVGSKVPDFALTKTDLSNCTRGDVSGKRVVLNIFPSVDTPVCSASVRKFNSDASSLNNTVVLCISKDLPFAHNRFCEGEGLDDVVPLSVFRSPQFGKDFGVEISSGPLSGLLSRAVIIVDEEGVIRYTEQVPEIAQEPDYEAAMSILR